MSTILRTPRTSRQSVTELTVSVFQECFGSHLRIFREVEDIGFTRQGLDLLFAIQSLSFSCAIDCGEDFPIIGIRGELDVSEF